MPSKPVPVVKSVYRSVAALKERESVEAFIHLHVAPAGTSEIVCRGKKPLRCRIRLADGKGDRRGLRGPLRFVTISR